MPQLVELIEETRRHLQGSARDQMNRLNGALTNSQTTVTLEFTMGGIQAGAVLSIDLELMYVWSVSGQNATVQRGFAGSAAVTHTTATLVFVNPRASAFAVREAINAELAAYSSPSIGLYRVRTVDITYSASANEYDLTSVTDIIEVIGVHTSLPGITDWYPVSSWNLTRDLPTATFPSGKALSIYTPVISGRSVRVVYAAPFVALTNLTDDVATVSFLPASAHDIPPLGAAARLLAGREARRAGIDAQPESRRAEEVPPGANRSAAGGLLALRDLRLREEATRLHAAYPSTRRRSA